VHCYGGYGLLVCLAKVSDCTVTLDVQRSAPCTSMDAGALLTTSIKDENIVTGGNGTVISAEDENSGDAVAIKISCPCSEPSSAVLKVNTAHQHCE
jgi:hypothetical protein